MKNMRQTKSMFKSLALTALMLFMGVNSASAQAGNISAPTSVTITPKNTSVDFQFTVGTVTNTILNRVEYSLGNSGTWTSTTTSNVNGTASGTFTASVNNLQTGTTYTMNIRVVGTATTSDVTSFQFTTTTLTAPTALVFTPSWRQLSLTFTAPQSDGGNGITGYKYSLDGGTIWANFNTVNPPIVLTGLTNGTQYSLLLRAVNALGDGAISTAVTGTPVAVANEPTITSVTRFNNSLSVAFTAPTVMNNDVAFSGAIPVTNYQYSVDNGATWVTRTPTLSTSPLLIDGLQLNTTYQVRLRAINAIGNGVASAATEATTHNLTAPTALVVTPSNRQLSVAFTAPATTSHSAIINYQYKVGDLDWVSAGVATSPLTISNLSNGVTYTVRVRAVNNGGVGAESAAVTGVPRDVNAVANVQFINNTKLGTIDVFAEGTKIRNDLEYQKATGFLTVDGDEEISLVFTNSDNTTTLGTYTGTFTVGANYIVVLQGGLVSVDKNSFEVKVIENARRVSTSATGVQYMFVHGITNGGKVNLERVSTTTPRNLEQLVGVGLEYGAFTSYQTFDKPGVTTFQLLSNPSRTVLGQFMFDFGSYDGKTVTLVGTGMVDGVDANKLNLLGFDANGNVVAPRVTTSNTDDTVEIPTEFVVYGNYPNPFNPTTNIKFDLPVNANVRVEIVDLLGRNVMTTSPMAMNAGSNKIITINATKLSSGVYFYKLIAEGSNNTFVKSSKFTLLK